MTNQIEGSKQNGEVTNCYLHPLEVEKLLQSGNMHRYQSGSNIILLQDKATCCLFYYFINDFDSIIELADDKDYLCEVIYRGEKVPELELEYLRRMGFENNAVRSIYQLMYKEATPYAMRSGCAIRFANSIEEVKEACLLFNATFDNISGDYITSDEYMDLLSGKAITVAIDENGRMAGAYQHDCMKNVAWGRHLAVKGEYRGRSVGKDLLYDFVERYHAQGATRFMLWCTIDNVAAVKMYETTGFKTIGRNCISMIRKKK